MPTAERFEGFVHAANGALVDGTGNPLRMRGVGLGNWLLPEGYMWKFEPGGPLSPREIEAFVADLVGSERAAKFWREFRERFITEADIARIAAEGFDHVRIAINSRFVITDDGAPIDEGFALIDRVIDWCRAQGLWAVLDLHGAPGGQTGTNIDDSPNGIPELFTDERYLRLTVELWQEIARRYRDEAVVAGYDLLNEPLPNEYQHRYAADLVALYKDLTAKIREIDRNHVLIYEGTHWSNNWSIFTEVWDQNSMLQCHKYWNPPDRVSVQRFLDISSQLGLPVYMGETGENNLAWMQTAFQLYDDCAMSWNLWPWKKIETVTSPCSINAPEGWSDIVAFARGLTTERPSPERAWAILNDLLDALDISRCTYRQDVVNAVLHRAPLRLPASGFSFRGPNVSYKTSGASPLPGFRHDDLVSVECESLDESGAPNFGHNDGAKRGVDEEIAVRLAPGDWLSYDVEIPADASVEVTVALRGDPAALGGVTPIGVSVGGEPLSNMASNMAASDGVVLGVAAVPAGCQQLRLTATAPVVVRWIDVALA